MNFDCRHRPSALLCSDPPFIRMRNLGTSGRLRRCANRIVLFAAIYFIYRARRPGPCCTRRGLSANRR
jgi:hypothetical protein